MANPNTFCYFYDIFSLPREKSTREARDYFPGTENERHFYPEW